LELYAERFTGEPKQLAHEAIEGIGLMEDTVQRVVRIASILPTRRELETIRRCIALLEPIRHPSGSARLQFIPILRSDGFSGGRWLHVFDLYKDDITVVDSLDDFVDVLLEVMLSRFLQMFVDQDVDGVFGGRTKALTEAAMVRQGIIAADIRMPGKFASHACSVQGAAPEFEDESLHSASLYAECALEAETCIRRNSQQLPETAQRKSTSDRRFPILLFISSEHLEETRKRPEF
jgi:hypothetical protein